MKRSFDLAAMPDHAFVRLADAAVILGICPRTLRNWANANTGPAVYRREQSQRRQIRSAFGQYLAPALVEQLANSPEKLTLGGEEREMTILFSDVRGFTAISELYKHDPHRLTVLMNRFLTPGTEAIMERSGYVDKYMGDAIMAFWNAPLDDPAHELHACDAALEMIRRIEGLNREREEEARAAEQSSCRSASGSE